MPERATNRKKLLAALAPVGLLAGCDSLTGEDYPHGTLLDPTDFLKAIAEKNVWCNQYRASDNSCLAVHRFVLNTEDGVVLEVVSLAAPGLKQYSHYRLWQDGDDLCRDPSSEEFFGTLDWIFTSNIEGKITGGDQSLKHSADEEMQAAHAADLKKIRDDTTLVPDTECFRYYDAHRPSEGQSKEILMRVFYDGVEQPERPEDSRSSFFAEDVTLNLRLAPETEEYLREEAAAQEAEKAAAE